jgi:hypothetical protein
MQALKELGHGDFNVCGRHSMVYPVQLPPWLDHRVVSHMVKRYETLLYEVLCEMWSRKEEAASSSLQPRISTESYASAARSERSSYSHVAPVPEKIGLFKYFFQNFMPRRW